MNFGQFLAKIIEDAIAGDPVAIETLKRTLERDPSRAHPHIIWVNQQGHVFDSLKTAARQRREVLPHIPRYGSAAFMKVLAVDTHGVMGHALHYPSLKERFASMAFEEVDHIESILVTSDRLSRAGRIRYKKRLQQIMNPDRPVWQNWLRSLHASSFDRLDRVIQSWLDEPIDLSEQHLFKPGWDQYPYALMSAKKFFDQLQVEHLVFLGLKSGLFTLSATGQTELLQTLTIPIQLANERAKTLGVKFKFETI